MVSSLFSKSELWSLDVRGTTDPSLNKPQEEKEQKVMVTIKRRDWYNDGNIIILKWL